jgi:hypothetical protein
LNAKIVSQIWRKNGVFAQTTASFFQNLIIIWLFEKKRQFFIIGKNGRKL